MDTLYQMLHRVRATIRRPVFQDFPDRDAFNAANEMERDLTAKLEALKTQALVYEEFCRKQAARKRQLAYEERARETNDMIG